MTSVEYTEQALEHLADLNDHVTDHVLNKVGELPPPPPRPEWEESDRP